MKTQILVYHFQDPSRLAALNKALMPLHIPCRMVSAADYDTPVGVLAGLEVSPAEDAPQGCALAEEMLLFCALTEQGLNLVLGALRRAGLKIPCKAFLTETNKDWTAMQLYAELRREHDQMQALQAEKVEKQ